jgi:hypothetical protein
MPELVRSIGQAECAGRHSWSGPPDIEHDRHAVSSGQRQSFFQPTLSAIGADIGDEQVDRPPG